MPSRKGRRPKFQARLKTRRIWKSTVHQRLLGFLASLEIHWDALIGAERSRRGRLPGELRQDSRPQALCLPDTAYRLKPTDRGQPTTDQVYPLDKPPMLHYTNVQI